LGSEKDLQAPSLDTAAIDAAVQRLMKTAGTPGCALVVIHGDHTYVQGYGVKEKGVDTPVTPDTLFANASTTKAVTTAAMALLVDDGKMAWNDPVRKHLPAFRLSDPLADAHVTVRDLVCHRTGLPRHDMLWYRSPYTREDILRRIGNAKLTASFRSTYQYQNICFLAAGEAVRAASGAPSFEAFVRERLLTPLGMERTNLSHRDAQADPDHASPHQRVKGKVRVTPWLDFDSIAPAGTMNSCAREMAAWLRLQLSGGLLPDGTRLISEANLRETRTPQMVMPVDDETRARYPHLTQMSYGLGWSLWNYGEGHGVVSHSGAIDGFRAHVALIPEKQIAVAIFVNLSAPVVEMIRNTVFDRLLGLPEADWDAAVRADLKKIEDDRKKQEKERREQRKSGKPSPLPLNAFAGSYEDPAYGTATVTHNGKKGGALTLSWGTFTRPLRHQTFTTFLAEPRDGEYPGASPTESKFSLDAAGGVTKLLLFDGEFTKAAPPAAKGQDGKSG
jgi:CubicO group peptidase (beta-lactamase class C family)